MRIFSLKLLNIEAISNESNITSLRDVPFLPKTSDVHNFYDINQTLPG